MMDVRCLDFGDGEIRLLEIKNRESKKLNDFQIANEDLSNRLNEIIKSNDEKVIVTLPSVFTYKDIKKLTRTEQLFWMKDIILNYNCYKKILNNKLYYNTSVSRPYMRFIDKSNAKNIFNQLKQVWDNRDIVIIEGKETRLGIGNDLFDNAKSISRILCPVKDAFFKYSEILDSSKKISKDKLIIIALGPSATVLAYDLAQDGYQALDLGHIDIEYEWFKLGVTEKVKIKGKYTNEAKDGNRVDNINDKEYENQIIKVI